MNLKSIFIAVGLVGLLSTPAQAVRGLFVSKTADCSDVKSPEGSTATGIVTYCLPGLGANQNQLMAWNGTAWVSTIVGGGDLTEVQGTTNEIAVTSGTGPIPVVGIAATPDLSGKVLLGGTPLVFEGATADANETSLVIADPTADRTVRIPDASGTVAYRTDLMFSATDYNFSTTDPSAVTVIGVANPIYHMPVLSKVTAGALALQNYSARITFTNGAGESLPSLVAVLTVEANKQLKIRSPFAEFWNALRTPTPSGIAGITVQYVRANNGAGTGQMIYTSAGTTLTWKAPGSATAGAAINIGAGGNFTVADGDDVTKTADVSVVAASLPGNTTVNPALTANPAALNATGWNVYVATTVGTETKQNGGTPLATSADYTVTSLVAGAALPTANTTGSTVVTPAAFANSAGFTSFYTPIITLGSGNEKSTHFQPLLIDEGGANEEIVLVSSVSGSTFTGVFTKTHSAGYTIKSATKGIAEAVFAIDPTAAYNPEGGGTILLPIGLSTIKAPIPLRDNTLFLGRGGPRLLGATPATVGQSQIRYDSTDTTKAAFFAQGNISTEGVNGVTLKNFFVNSQTNVVLVGGVIGGTAGFTIEGVHFVANFTVNAGIRASTVRAYYGTTYLKIVDSRLAGSPGIEITGANMIGFTIRDSWIDAQTQSLANGSQVVITANSGGVGGTSGGTLYVYDTVFEGGIAPIFDLTDVTNIIFQNSGNSDWNGGANTNVAKIALTQGSNSAAMVFRDAFFYSNATAAIAAMDFSQAAGSFIRQVVFDNVGFANTGFPAIDAHSIAGPFIVKGANQISLATSGTGSIQNPPTAGMIACGNLLIGTSSFDPRCNLAPNLVTDTGLLQQYKSTTAQSYEIYGTRTDASNYKRLKLNHDGTTATIAVQGAGTGAGAAALNLTTQGGNINLSGGAVTTDTSGFFVNSLTASRCVATDGSKQLVSSAGTDGCATGGGTATGTNTGDQTITLTTDVTGSGTGSFAATIVANAVSNAKLADVPTATFKGRTTAATGDPEDLTATQATALLNNMVGDSGAGGTKGLVPAPATGDAAANKFLKASGAWAVPSGAGDVVGPASATDECFARFDTTTGKLLQNSVLCATDAGVVTAGAGTTAGGQVTLGNATGDTLASSLTINSGDGAANIEPAYVTLWSSHTTKRKASIYPCTDADGFFCISAVTPPVTDGTNTILTTGGPLGTPSSGTATNLSGTAAGLTAGTVTTNANLTGPITSTGNATAVAAQTGTGSTFVMQTAPTITGGQHNAATSLGVRSTGTGAFDLKIANAENLTVSDKTLTVQLGDANRTLILGASPSVSGTNTGDQTITLTGDVTGSGTGSFATTIAADSVALGADTTGDYVSDVTANQGLVKTGTEGATVGLLVCTANQIIKKNAGNTAYECAADATGGSPSFDLVTAGTNANALVMGTGGTLGVSGTGTITANRFGPGRTTRTATATDLTIVATTHRLIGVTDVTTAPPRTITLPDSATAGAGAEFTIVDESNGAMANNITIARAGTDTFIGGDTSKLLDINAAAVTVYTNGSGTWFLK